MLICKHASSESFKSSSIYKVKDFILSLKEDGIEYKIYKKKKLVQKYFLLLSNSKKYINLNIKRVKKVTFKQQVHYVQFSSLSKAKIKEAYNIYLSKGYAKNDLVIILKNRRIDYYTVRYAQDAPQVVEANDETIADEVDEDEAVTSEELEDENNFRLAQSKLKLEKQIGHKNSYNLTYGDVLTGIEFENETVSAKIIGRVEYFDEVNERASFQDANYDLGETYLNFQVGNGQVTLGRQLFSWGTFDEFSNLDRVNIKNSPRFIFDSGESYRRPLTAIRYELYSGDFKFDTFFDFGIEPGREMNENSLWTGIDQEQGVVRGADTTLLNAYLVQNISTHFSARDESSFGLRATYSAWGDFSFTYLNAYPDLPIIEIADLLREQILTSSVSTSGLEAGIIFSFLKENVYGIDLAKTIAGQLYKVEMTYIPDSFVMTELYELEKMPKTRIAVGGDFEINLFSTTLTWQYLTEEVISSEKTLLDKKLSQFILNSSSRFVLDKLEAGARYVSNLNDNSSYFSPYLNYEMTDNDTIGFSMSVFSGEEDSFFGFHKNDNFSTFNYTRLF